MSTEQAERPQNPVNTGFEGVQDERMVLIMDFTLLSAQTSASAPTSPMVPLIVTPIIILIIVLLVKNSKKNKQKRNQRKAELQQQFDSAMSGFVTSKELKIGFQKFSVDDTNKKFAIINGQSVNVYNFSDMLDFELNEDGNSVAKGKGLATAVGAATFGLAGAMVGASGKRKNESMCTSMIVRIMMNNLENPQIVIPLISRETKKDSFEYKSNLEAAKNLVATLTYIESHNK